jgi:hypothetical protein
MQPVVQPSDGEWRKRVRHVVEDVVDVELTSARARRRSPDPAPWPCNATAPETMGAGHRSRLIAPAGALTGRGIRG